jgi:hypothetical protein
LFATLLTIYLPVLMVSAGGCESKWIQNDSPFRFFFSRYRNLMKRFHPISERLFHHLLNGAVILRSKKRLAKMFACFMVWCKEEQSSLSTLIPSIVQRIILNRTMLENNYLQLLQNLCHEGAYMPWISKPLACNPISPDEYEPTPAVETCEDEP